MAKMQPVIEQPEAELIDEQFLVPDVIVKVVEELVVEPTVEPVVEPTVEPVVETPHKKSGVFRLRPEYTQARVAGIVFLPGRVVEVPTDDARISELRACKYLVED